MIPGSFRDWTCAVDGVIEKSKAITDASNDACGEDFIMVKNKQFQKQ